MHKVLSGARAVLDPLRAGAHDSAMGALPERVRAVIAAQDRQSEHLIVLVQLGLGIVLAILFLLAPRPHEGGMMMFEPVPIALGIYFSFSLLRLALVVARPLPGRLVALSIVGDMAVLLWLIWAFHIQYEQPPAFSLKVPTFMYVFIFIVLRTLRFDPRYVLAAGLAAAGGWIVLTLAVVLASDAQAITGSFLAYVTQTRILIGAEVERVFVILVVTGLLAFGAQRAKATLVTAVREQAAGREVRRFLSRGVADAIAGADMLIAAGDAMERNAAILMLDIRGFTRFAASVPPRQVVQRLTAFHARVVPIVRANNGVIDKFLGDGVMATFGAVMPSATPAADALRALDLILEEAAAWQREHGAEGTGQELYVNASVAAGDVVFATLGNEDRLEYTVIGEPVNLAAKLEKHNKAEGTRAAIARAAYEAALAQGYVPAAAPEARSAARVAGVAAPMDLVVRR